MSSMQGKNVSVNDYSLIEWKIVFIMIISHQSTDYIRDPDPEIFYPDPVYEDFYLQTSCDKNFFLL